MEELTRQTHGRIRQTQMSALYEGFHFRHSQADQVDEEREKKRDTMKLADATSDNMGTSYLKVISSVAFSDLSIYTFKLPVSEHGS